MFFGGMLKELSEWNQSDSYSDFKLNCEGMSGCFEEDCREHCAKFLPILPSDPNNPLAWEQMLKIAGNMKLTDGLSQKIRKTWNLLTKQWSAIYSSSDDFPKEYRDYAKKFHDWGVKNGVYSK